MDVFIVGSGKLANAILDSDMSFSSGNIKKWEEKPLTYHEKSIIVHAGSGRQLQECIDYCERSNSILIELSTGLETERMNPDFTLIICPNTSILLLKTMYLIKHFGSYFLNNKVSIVESHQSSKKSVPGTAYNLAQSLQLPTGEIQSIREADIQIKEIKIPEEFLDKHAYHKIIIQDDLDEVTIETKVLGHASYSKGVKKIIDVVLKNNFEKKRYSILDLIENKLL